jgi:hypothetical protein
MTSHRICAARIAFPFAPTALLLGLAACASVREPLPTELTAWFAADAATRGPAPDASEPLDRAAALRWRDTAIAARRDAMQQTGQNDLVPPATSPKDATRGELRIGAFEMPYVMLQKGERPAKGCRAASGPTACSGASPRAACSPASRASPTATPTPPTGVRSTPAPAPRTAGAAGAPAASPTRPAPAPPRAAR